ncbi:unnamed protein product [Microthlaspi erraticum]|uniref:Uncharacterized protein n=1 Tax=Microthlaspi erraticum TaxID=1685480 RepID=A0A6D2J9P2_9BRAS|nr:unnamed protein product [Microthlaspi erraticum]
MRKDLQALHSKIDKLIVAQFPPKQVSSISDTTQAIKQEGEEQQHTSTPPTTRKTIYGHTFYQAPVAYRITPHRSNQQGHLPSFPPGFPPMPYSITQSQDWDMKDMLQQLLQGKPKGSLDMNHKLLDINSKLESLTSRVQTIESSSASSSSSQEYAQAITLRREDLVEYDDIPAPNSIELEQNPEPELGRAEETETQKDKPELDRAEKRTDKANSSQPTKPVARKKDTPPGPPPYKPPLPFPGRFKKQLLEAHKAKFDELMRQLELKLPFIDALMLIPPYQKFLKDDVQQRTREAQGMVVLTRECSAIIQRMDISDKKEDPGSFTLPCMLGSLSFKNSLFVREIQKIPTSYFVLFYSSPIISPS